MDTLQSIHKSFKFTAFNNSISSDKIWRAIGVSVVCFVHFVRRRQYHCQPIKAEFRKQSLAFLSVNRSEKVPKTFTFGRRNKVSYGSESLFFVFFFNFSLEWRPKAFVIKVGRFNSNKSVESLVLSHMLSTLW